MTETLTAYNQFEFFYVQQKGGRWQAQLVTKIHAKNTQGSSRKLTFRKLVEIPSRVPSKQFRIGYAIVLIDQRG
ncbi:hypothetical protein GI364_23025 [Alicyclobacillus sp. SO9]|nr:hypothetical protein GI364_23025 [Alicyclobacillus sp. SO9]